jgi:hypothetical protein
MSWQAKKLAEEIQKKHVKSQPHISATHLFA